MEPARHHTKPSPRPAFATILQPDTNVVSIPRPLYPFMKMRLEALAQRVTFNHTASLDTTDPDVGSLLASIPDSAERRFLAADIRHLAQQLGAVLARQHVRARLFVQRSDGCRKIHADNVTVRLLCTYAGPGTDWLPNEDVVRKYLVLADVDADTANRRIIRENRAPRRCTPGEVLLLKGNAHPGNAGRGAAHRSPPLGSSGVARLVLKIDADRCGC